MIDRYCATQSSYIMCEGLHDLMTHITVGRQSTALVMFKHLLVQGIKFFQCVGDTPHTKEFVESIDAKRKQIIDDGLREMREQDCTRFDTCIDQEKVVVNTTTLNDLTAKPKWDAFENNHFAMRRRLVSIFLRVSNKLICRIRAGHRLKKIWTWINNNGVKTREDMKLKVTEDNKIAKNTRLIDDTESVNDIRNIKFEFSFGASKIKQNL